MKDLIKKILKENGDLGWANDLVNGQELPFRIVGPVTENKKTNLFEVVTRWMSGDADAYNSETYLFSQNDPDDFENFVDLCRVYKVLRNDRWGYHDWDDINKLINPLGYCVRNWRNKYGGGLKSIDDFIERDVFSDGQHPASLESLNIFYYDNNGVKHNVILT